MEDIKEIEKTENNKKLNEYKPKKKKIKRRLFLEIYNFSLLRKIVVNYLRFHHVDEIGYKL